MAKKPGKKESFDCLLPTGLLLTVDVSPEATFNEVKKEIWSKAMHMPLFAVLQVWRLWEFVIAVTAPPSNRITSHHLTSPHPPHLGCFALWFAICEQAC